MLFLAVLNGGLREAVLKPQLGDMAARQVSTALLLALFAGWFWFLHRRWPLSSASQAWRGPLPPAMSFRISSDAVSAMPPTISSVSSRL